MVRSRTSRVRNGSLVWIATSLLGLVILLCTAYLVRPSIRAHYLFGRLEALQLGHSTFEDAQRLAKQIGAKPYGPCDRSVCEWDVRMDNSELPQWWRGLGESFVVSFTVKNSVVVRKNTGFGIGRVDSFSPSSVSLEEQEQWRHEPGREQVPVQAGWMTTELYRYYQFQVRMTPKASAEDRQRYTAFAYSCFWKYKGCSDARELLPTADSFPTE